MKRILNWAYLFSALIATGAFVVILACGGGGGSDSATVATSSTTGTTASLLSNPEGDTVLLNLKNAAAQGDSTAMESLFNADAWNSVYKDSLSSSNTDLQGLASALDNAVLDKSEANHLIYRVSVEENGKTISYDIQMVKENGVWKILSM